MFVIFCTCIVKFANSYKLLVVVPTYIYIYDKLNIALLKNGSDLILPGTFIFYINRKYVNKPSIEEVNVYN